MKLALSSLLPPLTFLFNESLLNAKFPDSWKKALVIPLPKTKVISTPSDTRPIAQLCELSKALERVVHHHLSGYLEAHSLLDDRQAGFRCGHSTQTALLKVTDDIRFATEQRKLTILILFDFSKAFDSIPHARLLHKLRNFNLSSRVLRWFYSYLSGRTQAVVDDRGSHSEWLQATSGVPQGSVLGPLLFSMYINDLPRVLRTTSHMTFADDLQIYLHFFLADLEQAFANINIDAQAVADWSRQNGIPINLDKTKAMILGSLQYLSARELDNPPRITIDEVEIPYVTEAKNLGVTLTPTLNFTPHIVLITKKIYRALFSLRFHRHALSLKLRKQLVESLIFPLFDYAAAVYAPMDDTRTILLQRAQNACTRFVYGNIPYRAHVTSYRMQSSWLSAKSRRDYLTASLAYSVLSKLYPPYLVERFTRIGEDVVVRRSARNPPALFTYSAPRTTAWQQSFMIRASALLNWFGATFLDPRKNAQFKHDLTIALLDRDKREWLERVRIEGIDYRPA